MSAPATTTANSGEAGFTHRQILVIMSGLMLGMFLAALDQTIVSTALPTRWRRHRRPRGRQAAGAARS
jgi:hypothetical protein